jgi:hypothetical protein
MKRKAISWLVASLTVVGVGAVTVAARATNDDDNDRGFSNHSIKGAWGFNSSFGMFVPPTVPERVPFVGMGRIVFDGNGGCVVSSLGNLDGQTIPSTSSSCSYKVNPDGTGTSEAVFPGTPIAGPIPVAFVIVDHGREMRFMNTKYIVATFTARRQ